LYWKPRSITTDYSACGGEGGEGGRGGRVISHSQPGHQLETTSQHHPSVTLSSGKSPRSQMSKRPGGHQRQFGRCEVETNLLHMPGIEPRFLRCETRGAVTVLTALSRLLLVTSSVVSVPFISSP